MATETIPSIDQELDDILAKLVKGERRDPDAVRLACERMDRMREELQKKVGIVDIAVPAIRELRDR